LGHDGQWWCEHQNHQKQNFLSHRIDNTFVLYSFRLQI
jgi:hypothetical protein